MLSRAHPERARLDRLTSDANETKIKRTQRRKNPPSKTTGQPFDAGDALGVGREQERSWRSHLGYLDFCVLVFVFLCFCVFGFCVFVFLCFCVFGFLVCGHSPHGDHATVRTVRLCTPSSSATVTHAPPAAREGAHSRTVLSLLHVARHRPWGSHATHHTRPLWPSNVSSQTISISAPSLHRSSSAAATALLGAVAAAAEVPGVGDGAASPPPPPPRPRPRKESMWL
jgi:hypothetical protein